MVNAELLEKIEKLSPELQSKVKETVDLLLVEENHNIKTDESKIKSGFGGLKGFIIYMADDFDAPLDDFKDYM